MEVQVQVQVQVQVEVQVQVQVQVTHLTMVLRRVLAVSVGLPTPATLPTTSPRRCSAIVSGHGSWGEGGQGREHEQQKCF